MKQNIFIPFLLVSCMTSSLMAFPGQGRGSLIYTYGAKPLKKGHLDLTLGTRYYGKVANFGGSKKAYTLWNITGLMSFNYGAGEHVELIFSPYLYQDTNRGSGFSKEAINVPDDMYLGVKLGNFSAYESPWVFGGLLSIRIPTARQHNIIYEPYSAGTLEFGLTGLVSYYSNVAFPEESWAAHFNLTYLNHNDVGKKLTDESTDPTANSMSTEIIMRAGYFYPAGTFDFSGELTARYFPVHPPASAYSREYVSYLTLSTYYKPYRFLSFYMGLDLRLITGEDVTGYNTTGETSITPPPTDEFPNYPGWRGLLGAKIALMPKSLYQSEEALLKKQARDRQTLLRKMIQEQKDTEDAEAELSRIRAERKRVEDELERLRKLLEEDKKE